MRTGAARSCPRLGGDSQRSAWRRWRQQGHRPLPAVGESGSAEGSGPAPEEMSEESSRTSLLCEASPQRKAVVGSAGRQSHQGGGLRPAVPQRNAGPVLQGSRAGPMAVAGAQDPRSPPGPQCPQGSGTPHQDPGRGQENIPVRWSSPVSGIPWGTPLGSRTPPVPSGLGFPFGTSQASWLFPPLPSSVASRTPGLMPPP